MISICDVNSAKYVPSTPVCVQQGRMKESGVSVPKAPFVLNLF